MAQCKVTAQGAPSPASFQASSSGPMHDGSFCLLFGGGRARGEAARVGRPQQQCSHHKRPRLYVPVRRRFELSGSIVFRLEMTTQSV